MRVNPLKSHLFWFVILGASIFAIDAAIRNQATEIVVDEAVVARIANLWQGQMQRAPTQEELDSLLADWLNEEMLYREAKRLGLDQDDVIVRRRLIQKIYFIAEESALEQPTEDDLRDWFTQHAEQFRLPARFSFSQVYFASEETARKQKAAVAAAGDEWQTLSQPSMINPTYRLRNSQEIQTVFGKQFVNVISDLAADGGWYGPIRSEFGWHLVRLDEKLAPVIPDFETARTDVLNDYLYKARLGARQSLLDELRSRYDVSYQL